MRSREESGVRRLCITPRTISAVSLASFWAASYLRRVAKSRGRGNKDNEEVQRTYIPTHRSLISADAAAPTSKRFIRSSVENDRGLTSIKHSVPTLTFSTTNAVPA